MRHEGLPAKFTHLCAGTDGREYIQCTRSGDLLVRTGPVKWGHFASAREWRARRAARLYPELIHLQRALKEVGSHEEVEGQIGALREARALLGALDENLPTRIGRLEGAPAAGPRPRERAPRSRSRSRPPYGTKPGVPGPRRACLHPCVRSAKIRGARQRETASPFHQRSTPDSNLEDPDRWQRRT